jgi:arylsulfatase A-like enzyme
MRTRRLSVTTASLALLLLVVGCSRDSSPATKPAAKRATGPAPNVVLISIDTLRRDHVGCYGYPRPTTPNVDRLASEGAVFENMISSASWTLPAHAAMLTGLADTVHGALDTDRKLADDRETLAERLKAVGYTTAGFFSGPTLHPAYGLGQGFDTYVDCTAYPELNAASAQQGKGIAVGSPLQVAAMHDVSSPRVYAAFQAWMKEPHPRPFFLFLHFYDPHFDFIPPPPYDTLFDPNYQGTVTGQNFIFDDQVNAQMPRRDLDHLIALYDGEIAWTDAHVGKVLDDLDAAGLRDSTLVVLLADHGIEFFEHNGKGHRHTLFDELIRIPFILRYPGHVPSGQRYGQQTSMIDVVPTVLELVGLPAATNVMGQSVVPLLKGGKLAQDNLAVSELFSLGRAFRAFRRLDRKLIRQEPTGKALVFDLKADPGERTPVGDASSVLAQAARHDAEQGSQWLVNFLKTLPRNTGGPELPDKVRKQLESLGYLRGKE